MWSNNLNKIIIGLKKFDGDSIHHRFSDNWMKQKITERRFRQPHCYWRRGILCRAKKVSNWRHQNRFLKSRYKINSVNHKYYGKITTNVV